MLRLKTWYEVHKWLSIFTGLALIMWLLTGMAMSWGRLFPEIHGLTPQPDFAAAALSPADAIARLEQANGHTQSIRAVSVRTILSQVVYEIETTEGAFYLIDAASGNLFTITPELAKQIARTEVPRDANVLSVEYIDANSRSYPFGPLPVYRVVFDDWRDTYSHVSIHPDPVWNAKTGDIRRTDRWGRIREILGALHTFGVLKVVINDGTIIMSTLWIAAIVSLFAALTGYYLALPRRWQNHLASLGNKAKK